MQRKVVLLAEGDASTADCWSGSGRRFVEALRRAGVEVVTINVELAGLSRAVAGAVAFHPDRQRWRQRFQLGPGATRLRSWQAARALRGVPGPVHAVIQIGATFRVRGNALKGIPYITYCDSNIQYALRGRPYSGATHLPESELPGVIQREQEVYDSVDRIWTMSNALARSFEQDFHQPHSKMVTVYAGANQTGMENRPHQTGNGLPPSILFVGKDHVRKGSELLLKAFARVREVVPTAELHIVGGKPEGSDAPGVTAYGFLSRAREADRQLLDNLFERATVFCLPSHYEPFGIAFVEAMLAGKPCIGTDAWAMPEIIEAGHTGWLIPDGSIEQLSTTLIGALGDREASARMGLAGRKRALSQFTWDLTAERVIADLEILVNQPR